MFGVLHVIVYGGGGFEAGDILVRREKDECNFPSNGALTLDSSILYCRTMPSSGHGATGMFRAGNLGHGDC